MWVHKTIIVADNVVQMARNMCQQLAGQGGTDMFITGLSETGSTPITHWISSGLIQSEFAMLLESPEMVYQVAMQSGIELPQGSVEYLLSNCDITDEPAETTLQRLNLSYVSIQDETNSDSL
jgi:hypothetical protein